MRFSPLECTREISTCKVRKSRKDLDRQIKGRSGLLKSPKGSFSISNFVNSEFRRERAQELGVPTHEVVKL
jgi:hypothetical protein